MPESGCGRWNNGLQPFSNLRSWEAAGLAATGQLLADLEPWLLRGICAPPPPRIVPFGLADLSLVTAQGALQKAMRFAL